HQVLVDDFRADRNSVYKEVADFYAFKTIDLDHTTIDEGMIEFMRRELNGLPVSIRELAVENHVLPYRLDLQVPDRLHIITPDPTKTEVYHIARAFPYRKFEISYVPSDQWAEVWQRVNIGRSTYREKENILRDMTATMEDFDDDGQLYEQAIEEEIHRSGLVDLVENIFVDAVRTGASDIHVIPRGERKTEFYFRVDGRLALWYSHTESRAEAVSAVVKDRAMNIDRFERNTAQDGFAQFIIDKKTARFRVSVIPIVGKELRNKFESIVIRVLQEPTVGMNISDLGFHAHAESVFRKAITKPYGIIIVTGPTGSGKSTTLVAALRTIMDSTRNIITVEDPVEYFIEGARQVKLNQKLDFEGALRAILRHDPDIVMVGEMRDSITANIAVKLANTGHLTLSTLHTNDAPSAVARLFKMGVEPFLIAYSVNIVVAQRLLRVLCERCKSPIQDPDREAFRRVGLTDEDIDSITFYRAIGCKHCLGGYKGRTAIHEALYFTRD
ncbi:MAG: GspE/PulE family protein, partial [Bacteroidota bacterium]